MCDRRWPFFGGRRPMTRKSKPTTEFAYVAKTRRCLMCREPFESSWAGERVCRCCKGRNSWREGSTSTSEYAVHRRR